MGPEQATLASPRSPSWPVNPRERGREPSLLLGAGPPQGPTARTTCSTRLTNRDHRADVADQPVAPSDSHGVVTIGRRGYRRYQSAQAFSRTSSLGSPTRTISGSP